MNIGVVITTFNSEDTIKECINSLISKKVDSSFKLKIIVVDDCSTDSTKNIISDYYSKGLISKAIYLSLNKGISAARNKGISECNDVDNIMFVDGDDSINIDFFDILKNNKESLTNYTVVASHAEITNKQNVIIEHFKENKVLSIENASLELYMDKYFTKPNKYSLFSRSWGRIYNMKIINGKNKLRFNEKMDTYEDVEFNFRYLLINPQIFYLNHLFYYHNLGNNRSRSKHLVFGKYNKHTSKYNKLISMFAFIYALHAAKKFYCKISNKKMIHIKKMIDHCSGAFICITLVRICGRINSLNDFFSINNEIGYILNRKFFINIFKNYDPKKAGGNILLTFLLKKKMFFLATLLGKYLFLKRYS